MKPLNGLIKKFPNIHQFCNGDINKFVLLLRKGVYLYEYIDSWERFDETSLPDKKAIYSEFYLEDITNEDYTHAQKVFEEFKLKNLDDYHDLYVQSHTLLLADVFEIFRNKCIEIYELDPVHFLPALRLAWEACLKETEVELEFLTDIDMLLMVEKGIWGGICHARHSYAKANNKYMKNYDKNIISSYLMYLDASNLYGWARSQNLPVNGFKWVKKLSKFDEHFIRNYDENSDKGYFLEVDVEYPKNLFSGVALNGIAFSGAALNLHCDLPFLPERNKIKKCNKLVCKIHDKENYVVHLILN